MSIFIFTGPTLSADAITAELPAVCLPPASQGDIYRASLDNPWAIGLIDGYFERVPAVWHKEILWALSRGIHVFGAASMGALRAAELYPFGMIGVGAIFEAFRDGQLEDDDEVAIVHADADHGYRPLSMPMVDIRATLAAAERDGVLRPDQRAVLEADLKGRHYAERHDAALLERARAIGAGDALKAWLPSGRVPQKQRDALQMITTMRDWIARGEDPPSVAFNFEHTDAWEQVTRRSGRQIAAAVRDDLPLEWLLDELRLDRREFTAAITGALARTLAIDAAERHDVNVEGPLFRQAIDEFRRAHELLDAPSLAAWMTKQEIDRDAFAALMHDEAQVSWARTLYGPDIGRRLVDSLRVSGTYGALAQRARDKVSRLSELGHENPSLSTAPVGLDGLLRWFFVERLGASIPANLDLHAVNRGYRDRDSFVQALLREYYYSR